MAVYPALLLYEQTHGRTHVYEVIRSRRAVGIDVRFNLILKYAVFPL